MLQYGARMLPDTSDGGKLFVYWVEYPRRHRRNTVLELLQFSSQMGETLRQ